MSDETKTTKRRGVPVAEAAQMMDCHPNTIRNHIKSGRLRSYRMGGTVRVLLEDLLRVQAV